MSSSSNPKLADSAQLFGDKVAIRDINRNARATAAKRSACQTFLLSDSDDEVIEDNYRLCVGVIEIS